VQIEMLECVYQHRLLSTAQLHALYRDGLSLRRTQRALAAMERVGWLASVRQPGGMKLWFVTGSGAHAVESIPNRVELRSKLLEQAQAAGPLQHHTLAVNEVGVAFVRAARERGDEFGPLAWRNEIAHPVGRGKSDVVIADAVLTYEQDAGEAVYTHLRFLELDRATMASEALVAKLRRYVELHNYVVAPSKHRGVKYTGLARWREQYTHFPAVMVVLANGPRHRLERRRWLTCGRWKTLHRERGRYVDLYVCLLEDLVEQGPFAPIFTSSDADELVDWLGNPPEADEPEEAATTDAVLDAADGEPAREVAVPDEAETPVDASYGNHLLPLEGVDPADRRRDPWEWP